VPPSLAALKRLERPEAGLAGFLLAGTHTAMPMARPHQTLSYSEGLAPLPCGWGNKQAILGAMLQLGFAFAIVAA
jgi:hypothetical protein